MKIERRAKENTPGPWMAVSVCVLVGMLSAGCSNTPIDTSNYGQGPAPLRMPSPAKEGQACSYEDSLTGGQVFTMYCSYCHNAPTLAERNFANFQNVGSHMRVRANLTGKEYAKLMEFLRRWNDIPPPTPLEEPSPKRLIFAQPVNELRDQAPPTAGAADAQPKDAGQPMADDAGGTAQ